MTAKRFFDLDSVELAPASPPKQEPAPYYRAGLLGFLAVMALLIEALIGTLRREGGNHRSGGASLPDQLRNHLARQLVQPAFKPMLLEPVSEDHLAGALESAQVIGSAARTLPAQEPIHIPLWWKQADTAILKTVIDR